VDGEVRHIAVTPSCEPRNRFWMGLVMDLRRDDRFIALGPTGDESGQALLAAEPGPKRAGVTGLMQGKRGLVMGVANDHSIAWGIAKVLREHGAELAFTYQGEALGKRVAPLAKALGSELVLPCDVEDLASVDAAFDALDRGWGALDFLVHAIAFSEKSELKGRYADTSRENFSRTLLISCFSFTEVAKRAAARMRNGGSMVTLTFGGSTRVMPNYNVMGVAKAALEASVRYLASDFGSDGIRVNAISAGPVRTLAGAGIADARLMFSYQKAHSPLRSSVSIEDVGGSALYLLSDLSRGVTGEIHYVDCGYNIISMPRPQVLKAQDEAGVTGK
jgi:enoyl-[acyl-carrier protein] reductase I